MDLNELRKLVRLMERADLNELEIDDANAGLRVHLKRGPGGSGGEGGSQPMVQPVVHMMPGTGAPAGGGLADTQFTPATAAAGEGGELPPGTEQFVSPMVGTFYRSASPDSDPFVEVGTSVGEDSTLCIVEAMKVMNEIKAELRGTIVEILAENGEPIEFGQPLFLIKKG